MESLPKIRLIIALISSWTATSRSTLKHFWPRPAFLEDGKNVLDTLFEATMKISTTGDATGNWTDSVVNLLDETGLHSRNFRLDWKRLYETAESRASFLPSSESSLEFQWRYSYLPTSFPHFDEKEEENGKVGENEEEETEMSSDGVNQSIKRKFCSRCFFNFSWQPASANWTEDLKESNADTWHEHMRHHWRRCFCGGAWIFLHWERDHTFPLAPPSAS